MNIHTQTPKQPTHSAATEPHPDPYKWHAIGITFLITVTLPAILIVMAITRSSPPQHPWIEAATALGVEPYTISLGEVTYRNTCSLCHGMDGGGVARLGKPLRNSAFVQDHTDDELLGLIAEGRLPSAPENTTGAMMPARGARGLSDKTLIYVVSYLRAIQDPSKPTVSIEDWILKTAGDGNSADELINGEDGIGHDLFIASCSACHGQSGEGMDGLGKPLNSSAFVSGKTDKDLITFIKMGRSSWDPENTTGLDMPSKGGNPALSDEQIADITLYIRSLHK